MAKAATTNNDEDLIDVGDANENAVDIELADDNDNPNIVDQLEAVDDNLEAEVEEDADAPKDTRTAEQKMQDYLEGDEELKEYYSKEVNKRIGKITYDMREAERQRDAATEYAQGVQAENVELKSKQQHQDGVFINEHKSRLEAQLDTAKAQYRDAHDSGDSSLLADANALLAQTAAELAQATQAETRFSRHVRTTPAPNENIAPYQPPAPENRPAEVDPKAQAWAEKNTWFGEDQDMTNAALNIHQTLINSEGYIPTGNGYYTELDARLRKNFPDKFEAPVPPEITGQQVVTPSSSATANAKPRGKRNVRLSASQVAIAKKLGVPLEEYAKYV